jgi:hypothetical protein
MMKREHFPVVGPRALVLILVLAGCGSSGSASPPPFAVHAITSVQGADYNRVQASPPDAQIAAGPTAVIQATNGSVSIYDKDGKVLKATTPEAFFGIPKGGGLNDPQLFYDPHTSRFFAAEDALTPSSLYIAASKTSDPLQGWTTAHILYETNDCPDQPHLGASNTVVAVGVFLFPGGCNSSTGGTPKSDLVIVDKQALMSGNTSPPYDRFSAEASQADFPLQDITPSNNLYVVHVVDPTKPVPDLYVATYKGVPPHGTFAANDLYFTIPTLTSPPDSADVEPTNLHLDLNDDRPRSGIVLGNTAYVAQHVACTPKGDTAVRSCLRILALDLANQKVIASATVASKGESLEYPAIAADSGGNVWVVAEYFSPTVDPGILAVVYKPRLAHASRVVIVQQGHAPIAPASSGDTMVRMGDYSGASQYAADPSTVWVTTQYGKSKGNWGTVVAHLGMG